MEDFTEAPRYLGHITNTSNSGIVTPSKHGPGGYAGKRLHHCACGVETYDEVCAPCKVALEAGIDLRVFKR
jgi:hypothetical protein